MTKANSIAPWMKSGTQSPVEYNGGQLVNVPSLSGSYRNSALVNPKAIAIDTLKLNYYGQFEEWNYQEEDGKINGFRFQFEKYDFGTKVFRNRYKVMLLSNEGLAEFGTLLTVPRSKVMKPDFCQLEIKNHVLYTYPDLYDQLQAFSDETRLVYRAVNRIDIAVDFHQFENHSFDEFRKIWHQGIISLKGRPKTYKEYGTVHGSNVQYQGFSIGLKGNERNLRCYNKTLEMAEVGEKEYIRDYWKIMGLDENRTVYRLEIQLMNEFIKTIPNFELKDICSGESMVQLFKEGLKNYFEFVYNQGYDKSNKSHQKVYELLNLDSLIVPSDKPKKVYSRKRPKMDKGGKRSKYIYMRSSFLEYVAEKQDELYLVTMKRVMEKYNLVQEFYERHQHWVNEFMEKRIVKYDFDYDLLKEHLDLEI